MFVASFVGSPAMSLIPLESREQGHRRGADQPGRLGAAAVGRQCAQGAVGQVRQGRARRAPLDGEAAQDRRCRARCRARSTRSSRPATSPSRRSSSTASMVNISLDPTFADPARRAGVHRVRPGAACTCSTAKPNGAQGGVNPGHHENHRDPSPTPPGSASGTSSSSRSRPTKASTAGAKRPVRPREGGSRGHRAYASSCSAAIPCRIGALWQEMYRSQYFEGGACYCRDLGHRHRAARYPGQGARRAGLPAARR